MLLTFIVAFTTIRGCPSDFLKTFSGHIFHGIDIKQTVKVISLKLSFLDFNLFLKFYMG